MKKIEFWVSVRPLGCYEDIIYVEEDATDEEIMEKIREKAEIDIGYNSFSGYKKVVREEYILDENQNFDNLW